MKILTPLLLLAGLLAPQALAAPPELEAAYQKEYAFLKAEKAALQDRLSRMDAEEAAGVARAEAEVSALQARLVQLTLTADKAEARLSEVERASISAEEAADLLATTLDQAGTTLDLELPEPDGEHDRRAEALRQVYEAAADRLLRAGAVRRTAGEFLLEDGTATSGTLIHLGEIATFGVSERGAGALAPAGQGHLRIWPQSDGGAAQALARGEVPESAGVLLYESATRRMEEPATKSALEVLDAGGVVAWAIAGLGAIAGLLMLARCVILFRRTGDAEALLERALPAAREGRLDEAAALAADGTSAGRVLSGLILSLERERAAVEDRAAELLLRETPRVERFGAAVLVIAAVAPLMGLLGTVSGMIATFDLITEFGTGDPKMLSGGISEALITTQLGLVVAIPAVLLGNVLSGRAEQALAAIERAALALINLERDEAPTWSTPGAPRGPTRVGGEQAARA
jgi:biopolymer transport protein ExbB